MLRFWGTKTLFIIVALALSLAAPIMKCAHAASEGAPLADPPKVDAPETPKPPEVPGTRCAAGYAFDPAKGECVACNRPCITGFKGICGRGIMDCVSETPVCRPTVERGDRIEICNGEDDDCDGAIDEGFDKDNDRYTTCSGDCNDRDPAIHPDAVERCNGADDNCNGLMDDGFNIGRSCTVGLGICMVKGKRVCAETGFEAICDAVAGKPETEICDGLDNDCDGEVDDGLGEQTCGVGACKRTVPVCEGGKMTACVPGEPTAEFCGDGVDNNCDGKVDEGFAELGRTCYEGVGACKNAGKFVCSTDLLALVCSAEAGEPSVEICGNKIDDDCDGAIDIDTPGLGNACDNGQLGECRREGTFVCDGSKRVLACSAGQVKPQNEVCDGKDNDCDGVVDNGVLNACGGCQKLPGAIGEACMVPGGDECATGLWTCNDAVPGEAICDMNSRASEGKGCASDSNPCTNDTCHEGRCTHLPLEDGVACEDGDKCTTGDTCSAGACKAGGPLVCDDENSCTENSCDTVKGCVFTKIGTGVVNSCGGCEKLPATPGSPCTLENAFGPCRVGQYGCMPDGTIACTRIAFGRTEGCNGIDDDCNGKIDDDLPLATCGIGACEVEIPSCRDGKPAKCVPRDPLPETCANMGVDDDCNGIADDVAGLGGRCPVPIRTCIVPGQHKCIGDAEKPICVPVNPRDAEDDDGNGLANYCDGEGRVEPEVAEEVGVTLAAGGGGTSGRSNLFDLTEARAAMLPWKKVYGSTVINSATPDRAMLLVSGELGKRSGVAVLRAKDAAKSTAPTFRTCYAAVGESPHTLIAVDGERGVIASIGNGYLRYHKIASQIPAPEAGKLDCRLYGERLPMAASRRVKLATGEVECEVSAIKDMAIIGEKPLKLVGAAACGIQGGSFLSRARSAVLLDTISQRADGGYDFDTVPLFYATGDVERAIVAPLGRGGGSLFTAATIKDKSVLGVCGSQAGSWKCDAKEDRAIGSPAVFAHVIGARDGKVHVLVLAESGSAFDVTVDPKGSWEVNKAGGAGGRGSIESAMLMPHQKGRPRILLIARENEIGVARISWTGDGFLRLTRMSGESIGPEAPKDGIFPGGKMAFGSPETLAILPLKRFGGDDIFAAFQIKKGLSTVGTMGFLYMNANEPPHGTITDIRVRDGQGKAKLAFTDPTDDALTYRAWIRANHGGSLDHWIDGLEGGTLRFSVKGDAAVGVWPIEITVEAADTGGKTSRVRAVVARDGRVESITEMTGR